MDRPRPFIVAPSGWEGRGLKPDSRLIELQARWVAPSGWEGRGLKHMQRGHQVLSARRSFRLGGAWIETRWLSLARVSVRLSLLPVGRGVD